jgi:hypothetical protein
MAGLKDATEAMTLKETVETVVGNWYLVRGKGGVYFPCELPSDKYPFISDFACFNNPGYNISNEPHELEIKNLRHDTSCESTRMMATRGSNEMHFRGNKTASLLVVWWSPVLDTQSVERAKERIK